LKKQGYRETTIRTASCSLKALAKCCDLRDTEKVKECIAFRDVSEGQKEKLCSARVEIPIVVLPEHITVWTHLVYRYIG